MDKKNVVFRSLISGIQMGQEALKTLPHIWDEIVASTRSALQAGRIRRCGQLCAFGGLVRCAVVALADCCGAVKTGLKSCGEVSLNG